MWLPDASVIVGVNFDHLKPFQFAVPGVPGSAGSPGIPVHVSFGLHTYSRKIEPGDDPRLFLGPPNDRRCFCPDRLALSCRLPQAVKQAGAGRVYFSQDLRMNDRNFLIVESDGGDPYIAAFNLVRAHNIPVGLAMFVVSAYRRAGLKVSRLQRIKFQTLALKIVADESVKRPPRR